MVVATRSPRIDSFVNRLQTYFFSSLINLFSEASFGDFGCGVRLVRKEAMEELDIYGDQHHFLPVIAKSQGYKVLEVNLPQDESDAHTRVYNPRIYIRRLLDLLTIVFLMKFNRKPLRFFGAIGGCSAFLGIFALFWVTVEKLFFDTNAGDRPLLVVSVLFIVLGVQLIAIGLVGETIVFTQSKDIKEYRVKESTPSPTPDN